ncbi:hypothetical protein J7E88_01310 [Streptomyces sp. ISL-10]|uniref:hypothetical protein n=1 Tax=Streptomyces sp. ISL-10 TaxID=2819172 RepID=UPI001BEA55C8|nr:hypothetical protein [Streptomyces sp. ISL-10]MBT2364003.1 hypothetical protein [Streptomyces sp. ISL-10]
MEQQIDPNIKPDFAVSTDPAFLPGLAAARPAPGAADGRGERGDREPEDAAAAADAPGTDADADDASGTADAEADDVSDTADEAGTGTGTEDSADDATAEADDADDTGPVFEVSDRRGSITANREGVRFRLDDQEADFRWDEIGAVEVKTPRFGRRFTVTVHVAANRWFNAEVEADARSRLKEWTAELDTVLDAYFEES